MKKSPILFIIFSIIFLSSNAQYYFKDIVSNKQLLADMSAYKQNKVKVINIKSLEPDGTESEGFFCQKKLSNDYTKASLFTRSDISGASMLTSAFNKKGLLIKTHDSSAISVTSTIYSYGDSDRIVSILSVIRSQDDDFTNEIMEEHIYQYSNGLPIKMTRVKNKKDSTIILFGLDENNQVAIEKDTRSGTKYYYYYDAKKRITDIVQENDFKTRMLPDYIFEYNNSAGLLSQMTTTEEGGNYYYVWKYIYDNGLRIKERCYSKERKLLGSIEYEYK